MAIIRMSEEQAIYHIAVLRAGAVGGALDGPGPVYSGRQRKVKKKLIHFSFTPPINRCLAGCLILCFTSVPSVGESAHSWSHEMKREVRPERNPTGLREIKYDLAALEAKALAAEKKRQLAASIPFLPASFCGGEEDSTTAEVGYLW